MKITDLTEFRYDLSCDCGVSFGAARPQFSFECPACGLAVDAAELFTEWAFAHGPVLPRVVTPNLRPAR